MKLFKNGIIVFIYIFLTALSSLTVPFSYETHKTSTNKISNFYRVSPPDSTECNLQTTAWLWYDNSNLFIHFETEIDDNFSEGKHAAYDGSTVSDFVRVQLITDVQNYYAYGYCAYPLGSKYDYIRNSELNNDKYWNSRYDYTTETKDSLWVVTFKIPFSDLRHTKSGPYSWKIILTRYQRKTRETFNAPFVVTKMGNDYFRNALDIEIPNNIHQQRKFIFKPYAIFTYDLKNKEIDLDEENFGLDISYNPNYSTRTKLSISPDYSDIPMDAVTDNYNSKYTPTFEENRYFFIEDFNAFRVGKSLFYSRNILQPQFAFKLTSNSKNYSFGILSSLDKLIEETIYDADIDSSYIETINPDDFFNIIAFQPFWDKFRCQFTLLNRINEDYHNEVLHLNPVWEVGKNKYFWSDLNTSLKKTEEDTYKGYYGKIGYRTYARKSMFSISAQQMSKNYRVDMGKIYEDNFYGWNLDYSSVQSVDSDIFGELETTVNLSEEIDNESNQLLERYLSMKNNIDTVYNIDFDLEFIYVKENVTPNDTYAKYIDKIILGAGIDWEKINYFKPGLSINRVRYYFYRLEDSYNGYVIQSKFSGIIDKYVSYFCSLDYSIYEEMPNTDLYDDQYLFLNFDLTINFSNRLSLSNGIRHNNYNSLHYDNSEYRNYSKYLGYFSNFKWEINANCNLYAGIKIAENTINKEREIDYNKFYLKLIYIF